MKALLRADEEKTGKSICCGCCEVTDEDEVEVEAGSRSISGVNPLMRLCFRRENTVGSDADSAAAGGDETIEEGVEPAPTSRRRGVLTAVSATSAVG